MANLGKRRRTRKDNNVNAPNDACSSQVQQNQATLSPATEDEKKNWQGFCEIESDPAFFNVMLREFGVVGVKVQELFGLDDDLLAMLPKPVYGLVFLFRFRDGDKEEQEASCPDNLWFANQISHNSCATVALINIVNNIPDIDLGEHLRAFKDFTKDFTPALRGIEIANFDFVKRIHNSFARKMDMLSSDFVMENSFSTRKSKSSKSKASSSYDDSALHFMAFIPIGDEVWKLDGLDRQPENLGTFTDDNWLQKATPIISAQMAEYEEDQIEFALLGLVKDPLIQLQQALHDNVCALEMIDDRHSATTDGANDLELPNAFEQNMLQESCITPELKERLAQATSPNLLTQLRSELENEQLSLKSAVKDEKQALGRDVVKASQRRHDYTLVIRSWLEMLIDKGELKTLIEQVG